MSAAAKPLEEYNRKRDFTVTPEPAGAEAPPHGGLTFVIHKHAARALHYDLRLEIGGVYASWAVPKGPSLDTKDRHLAVHVEDHPVAYGSFEGVIPAGEYGGGTVMIWDRGAFSPVGDPAAGVAGGHLKFVLAGSKMNGAWALVRMKPRPGDRRENWLLIKEKDDAVRPKEEYDLLAAEPDSAATGRTMEQIAESGVTWESNHAGGASESDPPAPEPAPAQSTGTPLPTDAPFQLATLVTRAPDGDEWVHEVKYDGYRLHAALEAGKARVLTRRGGDGTERLPGVASAGGALPISAARLDGEAVVLDAEGRSDFGLLQEALSTKRPERVTFSAFDVLYLDGFDLRAETLLRRKDVLASLLSHAPDDGVLRYVEHVVGGGPEFHAASCGLLLEGSMSKRGDRPWVPGRTRDWVKTKCLARQEFVVGGWTDPEGARNAFGALLVGVYGADGALHYSGRVGTGFTEGTLAELKKALGALAAKESPFADAPAHAGQHWVRPELVAEVAFREWTRDGVLRQPAFKGLRDDKDPKTVVREDPSAAPMDPPDADPPAEAPDPSPGKPITVGGVTITNPRRVLQPAGVTKADLARYYEAVSKWMLPHVADRPLTIVRCPHGAVDVGCFYQKHPESRGWPDVFGTVTIQDKEGPAVYFYVKDEAGLLALAQLGTLEIHTWSSPASDPEAPDRFVLDLDPGPEVAFADVAAAAVTVRDSLDALGLGAFVKTTGGHGPHVVTPTAPGGTDDG